MLTVGHHCAAVFTSAGEDGTVRQVDLRERSRSMTLMGEQAQRGTSVVRAVFLPHILALFQHRWHVK